MFLVRAPAAASTGTGEAAWRAQWCTRRAVRLPLGDRLTRHPEQDSQTLLGEATTGPQVLKVLTKGHGNSCTQAVGEAADIRFPCSGSSSTVPVRTMHIHHPTVAIHRATTYLPQPLVASTRTSREVMCSDPKARVPAQTFVLRRVFWIKMAPGGPEKRLPRDISHGDSILVVSYYLINKFLWSQQADSTISHDTSPI
ncbi:hypothetical protein PG2113B_1457 [Bifidobacterium pseudolongum subsp. globosum]|uniref:Uncharacterized protein n=1 Tax=Bifidobacterium pseudolongum subsp. globosum TaxID=1690 RepID=A0A2N3QQ92_9BIFI|nr:hypothetical protein CQR45_1517 [Bifidobacterium pseudolongum subsp. globosum]RYQ03515.1 hypothetical protein PG2113B_1457 [Bifidobacterium pseudolongum subsp. globosum]RYQ08816.1 hypothetical protein PG2098B_1457 [Bifidobacterium pseudolongum subsp. globosum]RYQ12610.1 hypothetical protein PG2088B_1461 [Bifidobacterium pseudolongum subsp. globosum]RYQ14905.1 hypothetical protein PG2086B_1458 [Bifidobacterium pseudolongum subsp. globosum]